ncbi:hypothetical protein [Flexivirga sp.]|uniref:hypothetical protein n=1 Tax=Flexivirga sp. TaxID=1962927 RepID=UPI003F81280E
MTVLVRYVILIVIVVAVVFVLRTVKPKLREQRHRRWEEAGLLPHQVDPHAPRKDTPEDEPRD